MSTKKIVTPVALSGLFVVMFVLGPSVKAVGPDIDDVTAVPTTTGATVSWTTDVSATCVLDYGTTSSAYTASGVSPSSTNHRVSFDSLQKNTKYYYQIRCTDVDGNLTTSLERTFTTKSSELAFTDVHVAALGANVMVVKAVTSKNAFTTLYYGTSVDDLTGTAGEANRSSPAGQTVHYHVVRGLQAKTKYYFKVTAGQSTLYDNPETAESTVISDVTRKQTRITSIAPTRGSNGTKLTIKGQGFGGGNSPLNQQLKTAVGIGCKLGTWPKKTPSCLGKVLSWTDSKIVVKVEKNVRSGPVYVGKAYDIGFEFNPVNVYTVKGPKFTKK